MRYALYFLFLATFAACNSDKEAKVKSMATKDSTAAVPINYPPVDNSIKFEMADPSVTATMLELYTEGLEKKSLLPAKKLFADTVMMYGGDGTSNCGSKESVLARNQGYWDNYISMRPVYHSFISLKSTDRDDTWFLIWYRLYTTDKKGKTDSIEVMENWKLNKDLKVTDLYQYQRHLTAAAKK